MELIRPIRAEADNPRTGLARRAKLLILAHGQDPAGLRKNSAAAIEKLVTLAAGYANLEPYS